MASRSFYQWCYSLVPALSKLNLQFTVGATGAVTASSTQGSGISSVTRVSAGIYKILLQDNYYKFLNFDWNMISPSSGSDLGVTALGAELTIGVAYVITTLGTTTTANWVTLGVPSSVTPAVGVAFVAAATGAGTGTGKVQLPLATGSGISVVEPIGNPNLTIKNQSNPYMLIQCLAPTNSSTTTLVATDPASGSIFQMDLWMRNSTLTQKGE